MIVGVLVSYLLTAGVLAVLQPMDLRGGPEAKASPPDESAHVAYFEELRTTRRLPRLTSGTGNYEAHQPPLYYLIATPVYCAFLGLGKPTAIIAVRMLNVLLGAASILLLARLAILAFPGNGYFVAMATVFGGLWPARIIACTGAGNDPLVEVACLAALVVLAGVATRPPTARNAFLAGVAIGLAMLAKSSALPLVPVGLLGVYLGWKRTSEGEDGGPEARRLATCAGALLAGVLILWGPWAARNVVLYGDPFAAAAFERIFKQDRATPEFFLSRGFSGLQYFALVAYQTALSFWGVLGQANIFLPSGLYALGFVFWGLTLIVALSGLIWRGDRPPSEAAPIWAMLALLGALMLAFYLRFNTVFYQAQARYFMPATAVVAFYMARPWARRDWPAWMRELSARALAVGILPFLLYMIYAVSTGVWVRSLEAMAGSVGK